MRRHPSIDTRDARRRARRRKRNAALGTVAALTLAIGVVPLTLRGHTGALATPPLPDTESQSLPPLPATPVRFPLGAWQAQHDVPGGIEGFAGRVSALPGDSVAVYVRTHATRYTAFVYRMGYYHGVGARLMATDKNLIGTLQPPCNVESRGMIECRWRKSFMLHVPLTWPSGVYLIKLSASDGSGSFVPLVIREAIPAAPILFQVSVTTWQAYDTFGGRDLYQGPCPPRLLPSPSETAKPTLTPSPSPTVSPSVSVSPSPSASILKIGFTQKTRAQPLDEGRGCAFDGRSRAVSFDRPYQWPGSGQFLRFEYPMLYWLESRGYHVAYATDIDLHEGLDSLSSRKVFIAAGHDEYYSLQMRRALEGALAQGTDLIFMGADDIYRHIRFESSPLGPDRVIVNYKIAGEDPLSATDPLESTGQWREWPTGDPEQQLLGA
ncbi:MAG TPA: N,N-dimethylformamidase beta subunit family domain-containing protein, partial [Actinomycetota bacterium]|nr:N,N-dimethylformamidase beta subunit family domain-containing protein [Actinomycetota bacterium]